MGDALGVRTGPLSARELAGHSQVALDVELSGDAELWVNGVTTEARVLGAFERRTEVPVDLSLLRRGSGGPEVLVGPGTLYVALRLARPDALVECNANKLVNRHVRPLLRALTKIGAPAHYFGRDWISVQHHPAAWIGFAHDARTGRAVVEAFLAVEAPFANAPRASFLGKTPRTLASLVGRSIDPTRIVDAIVTSYASAYARSTRTLETPLVFPDTAPEPRADIPWRATREEAIGPVAAGPDSRGILRLGGALLASRDAVADAESRAAAIGARPDEMGRMVEEVFEAPGVALDGVLSLESLRDVLLEAVR